MLIWCSNRRVLRYIFHIFRLEHHQKSIIFNVVQRIIFLIKYKSLGFYSENNSKGLFSLFSLYQILICAKTLIITLVTCFNEILIQLLHQSISIPASINFSRMVGFFFVSFLIVKSSALSLASLRLFSEDNKASLTLLK